MTHWKRLSLNLKNPDAGMATPRRNPKRKANSDTNYTADIDQDRLLEESLKPLTEEERASWPGWIELESEPSFFNIMLQDLGIKDVKTHELFSLDDESLALLPQPIYGLIFLFQYSASDDVVREKEESKDVWFANQTSVNACATVALLNIIMNHKTLNIGPQLNEFYKETLPVGPPLRGYKLSENTFIRAIHNKFARRMDHLLSDASLQEESTKRKPPKFRRKTPLLGMKRKGSRKKANMQYAYHFVAYVPVGDAVYELDGLKTSPLKLGEFTSSAPWTSIARPQIQARMLEHEESEHSFNLLSLCSNTSLETLRAKVCETLASVSLASGYIKQKAKDIDLSNEPAELHDVEKLAGFKLTMDDIDISVQQLSAKSSDVEEAAAPDDLYIRWLQLVENSTSAMASYRQEVLDAAQDQHRVSNRQKDYGFALHKWLSILADKGVLEGLVESSSS